MSMPFRSKLALTALALSASLATAQKAGPFLFSYSGQLLDGEKPVTGTIDVELRFYRQASGGEALKVSPIVKSGVPLTNEGVFQVEIDQLLDEEMNVVFDATRPTWVEVIAGGKAYPRQMLAAVPFAMKVPVTGKSVRYDEKGRLTVGPDASPGANQFLTRGSDGEWTWGTPSTSATALAGAAVDTAAPAAGQVLSYDAVAGKWKPTPLLPSGGANGQFLKTDGAGGLSWGTPAGAGDMQRSVYDGNANNIVNDSEALGGQAPSYYRNASNLNAGTVATTLLPAATATSVGVVELATNGETAAGVVVQGNDSRLNDTRIPTNDSVTGAKILDGSIDPDDLSDLTRSTLDASDGTPASAVAVNASGFVGIGTTGPGALLHVDQGGAINNLALFGGGSSSVGGNTYLTLGRSAATGGSVWITGFYSGGGDAPIGLNPYGGGVGIGLGTVAPAATLEVQAPSAATIVMASQYSSDTTPPVYVLRKARGTVGGELALVNGDAVGVVRAQGHDGAGYAVGSDVRFVANENWNATAHGTKVVISTTSNGTTTKTDRVTVLDNGNVGIGDSAPAMKLTVAGPVFSQSGGYKFPDGTTQASAASVATGVCNGRLTLAAGEPVTTSPQTGKTTLYFSPYGGNTIALYSGGSWKHFTFSELSIAVTGSVNALHDVFAYDMGGGSVGLEIGLAWTNDMTRSTALVRQDGVWVKSGNATRRYLGTYRATGSGITEDSFGKRFLWNACSRVKRPIILQMTSSWSYTSPTWRYANGTNTSRIEFVHGLGDGLIDVTAQGSGSGASGGKIGLGINAVTPAFFASVGGASLPSTASIRFTDNLQPGYFYISFLEYGNSGVNFYGDNTFGITGHIDH